LRSLGDHLQVLSPTTRLYSRHQRTRVLQDWIAAIPPSLSPLLKFACSCRCFIRLLFQSTTNDTEARSRARGRRSSRCIGGSSSFNGAVGQVLSILAPGSPACWAMRASTDDTAGDSRTSGGAHRSAPSVSTCLASRKQKWFTNTPPRHGRIRKCEGTLKATTKTKRAQAKIQLQYEHLGVQICMYFSVGPSRQREALVWLPRRAGSSGISWRIQSLVKRTLHRNRAGFEPQRASSFMKRVKASQMLV
jgi:hypothetical protein